MTKTQDKAVGLAYIDARDVMERLDNVLGIYGWQCRYSGSGSTTVCEIGLYHPDTQEWVWKADGGGESDIEAEKGALSGAFKRAAVRWGIGRYLYSMGNIWVPLENKRFTSDALDQLSRHHEMFIKKLEWGGEAEGPIVGSIVRFLVSTIKATVKTREHVTEFLEVNNGVISALPEVAQKAINDALRPFVER